MTGPQNVNYYLVSDAQMAGLDDTRLAILGLAQLVSGGEWNEPIVEVERPLLRTLLERLAEGIKINADPEAVDNIWLSTEELQDMKRPAPGEEKRSKM
ncbi:hypothetical protein [uncultured Croceicoccus sp.]|uniref:hypothetical protein n=1 Tax=uncultured Croceicoccus sp. TaxID=1295329 RepID=UPI0026222AEB|nr:hypothetical protein [uncultured Croceicoccus sp.]